MQVGVLDFAHGARNKPGTVCIDRALEYEVVVDKAFGPECTAVVAPVREAYMALIVKHVVDNYLRVACPATAADIQVRVEFDLVVFSKNVQLSNVEQLRRYLSEIDIRKVQVTNQLVALAVSEVTIQHARSKGAVVQAFKQQRNTEVVRRNVGEQNFYRQERCRLEVWIRIVRQNEYG